jgi:hypothetical protein
MSGIATGALVPAHQPGPGVGDPLLGGNSGQTEVYRIVGHEKLISVRLSRFTTIAWHIVFLLP